MFAPCFDAVGQHLHQFDRIVPRQAGVGDALAVLQLGRVVLACGELLRPAVQMALGHDAENAALSSSQLRGDVARYVELTHVLLGAVGVRTVDHQAAVELGLFECGAGLAHAGGVVVRRLAAAQNDVGVFIATGLHDGHLTVLVH